MTTPALRLAAAQAEAAAARRALGTTLADIQLRLNPYTIATAALGEVRERGEALADDAVTFARERPYVTGAAATAAVALIARKPLASAIRALLRRKPAKIVPPPETSGPPGRLLTASAVHGPDPLFVAPDEETIP